MRTIDSSNRCPWVDLTKPDYVEYHDREWGVPVHDDKAIFEFLTLEAAQAGLSWYTVLRKDIEGFGWNPLYLSSYHPLRSLKRAAA